MISLNDVLLAMSNIPVDDPIAEIWGRGLQSGYKIIAGTLPITINANGDTLLDYRIYGASGGAGVATENMFDPNAKNVDNGYIAKSAIGYPDGEITSISWAYVTEYIPVDSNTNYVMFMNLYRAANSPVARGLVFYDENKDFISAIQGCTALRKVTYEDPKYGRISFTTPENCRYIRTNVDALATMLMLVAASTPPPKYIPYGYKLPMTVSDGETTQTVPVYIGENQLAENEYVSYSEQKIYRDVSGTLTPTDPPVPLPSLPTINGETVIDYDGEPKPSQMYVKYKGKE